MFQLRQQVKYRDMDRVEHGFVVGLGASSQTAYCRFWNEPTPDRLRIELRTKANAEGCNFEDIEPDNFVPQEMIETICDAMGWAR